MKLSAIIIMCTMALTGYSQDSSTSRTPEGKTCEEYKSLYYQYLSNKMYRDARNFWLLAYEKCGGTENMNNTFFTNGTIIYDKLASETFKDDSIHQREVLDSIPWIYEQYLIINPSDDLKLKYASILLKEKSTDTIRMNELFESIHILKGNASANQLCIYFKNGVLNQYYPSRGVERERIKEKLFNDYFLLVTYANEAIERCRTIAVESNRSRHIASYEKAKNYLQDYLVAVIADCETLSKLLDKRVEKEGGISSISESEIKESLALIKRLKCTSLDVYPIYVQGALTINPNTEGYKNLGILEFSRGNYPAAVSAYVSAYETAIEMEPSDSIQSEIRYLLAVTYYEMKQYRKAMDLAKKVSGVNRGKAFIICGNVIAVMANKCGSSTFERESNFWLANDYYRKAADLGEPIDRNKFSDSWPDPNACFQQNYKMGESLLLPCWNEKTIIRE